MDRREIKPIWVIGLLAAGVAFFAAGSPGIRLLDLTGLLPLAPLARLLATLWDIFATGKITPVGAKVVAAECGAVFTAMNTVNQNAKRQATEADRQAKARGFQARLEGIGAGKDVAAAYALLFYAKYAEGKAKDFIRPLQVAIGRVNATGSFNADSERRIDEIINAPANVSWFPALPARQIEGLPGAVGREAGDDSLASLINLPAYLDTLHGLTALETERQLAPAAVLAIGFQLDVLRQRFERLAEEA